LAYHKAIVLCETDDIAEFMTEAFEAYSMDETYHPRLMGCKPYSKVQFDEFSNLNNRFAREIFHVDVRNIEQTIESGILFITMDTLVNLIRSPIQLRYVDLLWTLNSDGLNEDAKYLMSQILNVNSTIRSDKVKGSSFMYVDVYRKVLAKQLQQIYESVYHQNVNGEIAETRALMDNGDKKEGRALKKFHRWNAFTELLLLEREKTIETEPRLTDLRLQKLETLYSINRADQDYINRHSIAYINTIFTTKNMKDPMSTTNMYRKEAKFLYVPSPKTGNMKGFLRNQAYYDAVQDRTDELRHEVSQIVNAKSDKARLKNYSGPVWLGKVNGKEMEGSLIGFADKKNDTIEFAQIMGTYKFTRTYKRDGWTEKENRDKKILFLSPVFEKRKLSEFKLRINRPAYQRFSRMEKVRYN